MNDNNNKYQVIMVLGDTNMDKFLEFLQELFKLKKDDNIKVGLSQFKQESPEPVRKKVSIGTKDVKLSDLMRRAG